VVRRPVPARRRRSPHYGGGSPSAAPAAPPLWVHIPTVIALVGFLLVAGVALCLSLCRVVRGR
jgi:hypothetical protein